MLSRPGPPNDCMSELKRYNRPVRGAPRTRRALYLSSCATRHGYASSVPTRPPPKVALARTLAHALPRRSSPEHSGCAPTPPPPSPTPDASIVRRPPATELSSTAGRSDLPPKSWSLIHRRSVGYECKSVGLLPVCVTLRVVRVLSAPAEGRARSFRTSIRDPPSGFTQQSTAELVVPPVYIRYTQLACLRCFGAALHSCSLRV